MLLRLSPELSGEWIRQSSMAAYVGGAELNVAGALANWGANVSYCTLAPDHYLTTEILESLTTRGIDVSAVLKAGQRLGIYILPAGADLKHAGVIYDRAHSSFSDLKPGMIDWPKLLQGKSWFHFSAISPALNESVAMACVEAAKAASEAGLTVSIDLNYRAKLWQYGLRPVAVMEQLLPYCDVVMGNSWAAESLLDISSPIRDSRGVPEKELEMAAVSSMEQIQQRFPRARTFAYTYRLDREYWAVIKTPTMQTRSRSFELNDPVDRVGSGDCFMAGLIYGLQQNWSATQIIDFAASAAVGKLYEKGDATRQTIDSILSRLNGASSTMPANSL